MTDPLIKMARLMLEWVANVEFTEPHANLDAETEYLEEQIVETALEIVAAAEEEL